MIGAGATLLGLLLGGAPSHAGRTPLARVELLADDTGDFFNYELPLIGARPGVVGLSWLAQVQPVWNTGVDGLSVGTSLRVQTVQYARAIGATDLGWLAGVQTRLGLPMGTLGTVTWTRRRLYLGAGLSVVSEASWARPQWKSWRPMPTLCVAIRFGAE